MPRAVLALAVALSLAALALRLQGLGHGLPHAPEPDAYLVDQARLHRAGVIRTAVDARNFAKYPHLLSRLQALFPEPGGAAATVEEELARAARPYVHGRLVTALAAGLLVPGVLLLARRFLEPGWALAAAALAATSLLHLELSQQARPHAPVATLVLAAWLAALRHLDRPGPARALVAGLAAALAVACLHNGAQALLALGAALFLARGRGERGAGSARLREAALAALPLVVLAPLAYPFLFPALRRALPVFAADRTGLEPVFPHQAGIHWAEWLDGSGFGEVARLAWSFDPVLAALAATGAALGLVALARRRPVGPQGARGARLRELAVVGASALPYLLVLGAFQRTYERFLLPLLPVACCLAVLPLRALARRAPAPAAAGVALALAALALPAAVAAKRAALRARPDTETELAAWLARESDPAGPPLAVLPAAAFPLPVRLAPTADAGARRVHGLLPWPRWLAEHPRADRAEWTVVPVEVDVDDLRRRGARATAQALAEELGRSGARFAAVHARRGKPEHDCARAALEGLGSRAALFSPDGGEGERGGSEALRVLAAERTGADWEVWRLDARPR